MQFREATATREVLPSTAEFLYVSIFEGVPPPEYGDRVRLSGLLVRPAGVRNPGEFDFANYLRRQGYAAELHVDRRRR